MIRFIIHFFILFAFIPASYSEELDVLTTGNDDDYVVIPGYEPPSEDSDGEFKVLEKVNVKDLTLPSCEDVPIYFDTCLASACESVDPFGKVLRKINGLDEQGNCKYVERTKGFGGLDCLFPKDTLREVNNYYQNFFFATEDSGDSLSTADIEYFKSLKGKSCQSVEDSTLTKTVSLDEDGNSIVSQQDVDFSAFSIEPVEIDELDNQGSLPVNTDDSQSNTVQTTVANNITQSAEEEVEDDFSVFSVFDIKSVMFTQSEIDQINNVLRGPAEDSEGGGIFTKVKTTRSYYLKSIMFFNKKKWALWINDLKISSDALGGGLQVDDINNKSVILRWNAPLSSLDRISPAWRDKLVPVSERRYVSEDNMITIEIPDESSARVKFKLSPNQTFDASNMLIKEGNLS